MREIERTFASPVRIGNDLIAIPEGTDVDMDLRVESVSEGVLVTGTITGDLAGECSRCLEPITGHADATITELFAYPDSETEATTEEGDCARLGACSGVPPRLSGAVPRLRNRLGDSRTGPSSRQDRSALGQTCQLR